MFVGHLAAALGAKTVAREAPLPLLIGASFGIDILWPVLLLVGAETVVVDPGNTAFTALDFAWYPWSHSLLMVVVWGVLLAGVVRMAGGSRRVASVSALVLVSHWVLDWITHGPDLPLWPGGVETGLGLWHSVPGTLAVEGLLLVAALVVFFRVVDVPGRQGHLALWSLVGLCVLIWASQPFSPPPPGTTAIAVVGLSMWLLPLWGWWIERNVTVRA
ncbi:MAG: hypothetical protein RIE53_01865 [Rhodothermales bacterium]